MKVTIKGVVKEVMPVKEVSGGKYRITTIVLAVEGEKREENYPIDYWGDSVADVVEGMELVCECELGGREYNGKYYLGLKGVSIKDAHLGSVGVVEKSQLKKGAKVEFKDGEHLGNDDLPF